MAARSLFSSCLRVPALKSRTPPPLFWYSKQPVQVTEGQASYVAVPATDYRVTTTIRFDHPLIGEQTAGYRIDEPTFRDELSAARTFGFLHEVEQLRERARAQSVGRWTTASS